jgi:acetylornithine deacetylase/succinyl-diaminopimelate desuccinylase-like protein
MKNNTDTYTLLDALIDQRFEEQVAFLQELVRVPTDTPPGDNAPHAKRAAELLTALGFEAAAYPVPAALVKEAGLASITNLIVRQHFGDGPVVALNAHGDVVPPGPGWTHPPYHGEISDGRLYGRGAAVSKSDFSTFAFALRALIDAQLMLAGSVELHFTYDEEFGGELGPGYLLREQLTAPDIVIAAGFSYQVINAHNGCLQFEVTLTGRMAHAAIPATGVDALQGAVAVINQLYLENQRLATIHSAVDGIDSPYLNIGLISGGTNTNVVPGEVVFKLDRRLVPEEDPATVERELRGLMERSTPQTEGLRMSVRRILFADPLRPTAASQHVAQVLQAHASNLFGEDVPICGTPLYADARLYAAHGAAAVLYGAGPKTLLESNAKRADEHVVLNDLRGATKVIARSLFDLLEDKTAT